MICHFFLQRVSVREVGSFIYIRSFYVQTRVCRSCFSCWNTTQPFDELELGNIFGDNLILYGTEFYTHNWSMSRATSKRVNEPRKQPQKYITHKIVLLKKIRDEWRVLTIRCKSISSLVYQRIEPACRIAQQCVWVNGSSFGIASICIVVAYDTLRRSILPTGCVVTHNFLFVPRQGTEKAHATKFLLIFDTMFLLFTTKASK